MERNIDYCWKFILCLIILLSQLHLIATEDKNKNTKVEIQSQVDVGKFSPERVTPIFEEMRKHGEEKRKTRNKKIKKQEKPYMQYLLITIMSDEEIDEVNTWRKSFREKFMNSNRFIFLLNKRKHMINGYNPQRQLHGEIYATHFGQIKQLMDEFKTNPKTKYKYPIILLYSHYIPCAHVKNLGYSCSEELMNYAKGRMQEFSLLVAYTTYFSGTDKKQSFQFMKEGGIRAFHYMTDGPYKHKLKAYPPSSIDGIQKTFQGEAYDCIITFPPSTCCTKVEDRPAITAYFINYVTYQCIFSSKAFRLFTELSRNQLKTCLKNELDTNIGDDCIECSNKNKNTRRATKALFQFCFDRSIEVAPGLGKQLNNVYTPEWVLCRNCNWDAIYDPPGPQSEKKHLPKIMCANRVNSMESLCSLYEKNKKEKKTRYYSEAFNKLYRHNVHYKK